MPPHTDACVGAFLWQPFKSCPSKANANKVRPVAGDHLSIVSPAALGYEGHLRCRSSQIDSENIDHKCWLSA